MVRVISSKCDNCRIVTISISVETEERVKENNNKMSYCLECEKRTSYKVIKDVYLKEN